MQEHIDIVQEGNLITIRDTLRDDDHYVSFKVINKETAFMLTSALLSTVHAGKNIIEVRYER